METTGYILVVSDDACLGDQITSCLPEHLEVELASDSREAWATMSKRSAPAAVVLEIRSGSAGGFGLSRDMSQRDRLRTVPLVMLLERTQDGWLAEQAGARATLLLPADPSAIVASTLALLEEQVAN